MFSNLYWLQRRNANLSGISVMETPVRPTLGIMCTWHNITSAGLLTPPGVGTIVTKVSQSDHENWLSGWMLLLAGPCSLHTTLGGTTEYMWMQDGCKVYVDSYVALNGSCFMVIWTIFKNVLFRGRPNTKLGDHGTPNVQNRWLITFYHERGPTWIEIHWNSI